MAFKNLSAKEQGINTSRTFVVVKDNPWLTLGTRVQFLGEIDDQMPCFRELGRQGFTWYLKWDLLTYDTGWSFGQIPYTGTVTFSGGDGAITAESLNKSIEALKPKTLMSSLIQTFRNLTLSADDKLLVDLGLEDPSGVPTSWGYDLMREVVYKANREKLIEAAKKIKAEKDAK